MGILSDLWDATCSCVRSCCSKIGSAINAVSSSLAEIAKPLLEVVARLPEVLIKAVVATIHSIAVALGIVEDKVEPEEIGVRALEYPEVKPENYDTYEEYINALMEKDFDFESWEKNASVEEKATATVLGSSLEAKAVAEKIGMNIPIVVYLTAHNNGYTPKELQKAFESLKANGISDAGVITSYFNGDLKGEMNEKVGAILGEAKMPEVTKQ